MAQNVTNTEQPQTDRSLKLYIASGNHITRPQRRIEEIEEVFDEIDVVFAESPRSNSPGWRTIAMNFIGVPVLVATIYLWVAILTIWAVFTKQEDETIVRYLETEHGAEVIPTDRNVHRLIAKERGVWSIGHLIVVLLGALAIPEFLAYTPSYTTPVIWLLTLALLTGTGLFILFLAGTVHARDMQFIRDIETYALTNNAQNACLIIGGQHEPGVREGLEENDFITIIESESEGLED